MTEARSSVFLVSLCVSSIALSQQTNVTHLRVSTKAFDRSVGNFGSAI